jgi:toluene monooxygenase system ferredoxin subunit
MAVGDLWSGEIVGVEATDWKILLVNCEGEIRAYEDKCPHLENPLSEGDLDGKKLTCSYHLWEYDVLTGRGINPEGSRLKEFPVRIDAGNILVGLPDAGAPEQAAASQKRWGT